MSSAAVSPDAGAEGPRIDGNASVSGRWPMTTIIDRVRRLFGVKTDTEAIQKALGKAIEDREVEERLDALLKKGRFRTVYR